MIVLERENSPGDSRSITQLARKAGASLRTLERCFLTETGVSVGEWRRRVRLFHALRLLEGGEAVGDVAEAIGYEYERVLAGVLAAVQKIAENKATPTNMAAPYSTVKK